MGTNKERDAYFNDGAVEPVYPEEFIGGYGALKALVRGGKELLANRVKNYVVETEPHTSKLLYGRSPTPGVAPTHAYRTMSQVEAQSAKEVGRFRKDPNPSPNLKWDPNEKGWRSGDETGHFGRDWKSGQGTVDVRAPIDKVKGNNWAVKAKHAERLDKETGQWETFAKGGTVRGNGCCARPKKCKIR